MAGDSNVQIAYGLDLAGYYQGRKSALAWLTRQCGSRTVSAQVLSGHPFAKRRIRADRFSVKCEREAIKFMLGEGRLCVDVPIDLQGLMGLDPRTESGDVDPQFVWELTLRPVDYAFDALAPLADRIGSPVVRFRHILSTGQRDQLGLRLWETYPRASLSLLGDFKKCGNQQGNLTYKDGRAKQEDGKWVPCLSRKDRDAADRAVACMATEIGITSKDGITINDDELDAVICALTGVAPRSDLLCGAPMEEAISCRIKKKLGTQEARVTAPRGYVLLQRRFWSEIHLEKAEWKGDSEHG